MDVSKYERAINNTGKIVSGIGPEQFGNPTPCTEWDVRGVLNHLIGGFGRFAARISGEEVDQSEKDHIGSDHVAAYERASRLAIDAFSAPGALEKKLPMPFGEVPGTAVLGIATSDVTVHGWDLAQATDQDVAIDDDIAQELYKLTSSAMAPKGPMDRRTAFKQPVAIDDDAPAADKLLAYLGRNP